MRCVNCLGTKLLLSPLTEEEAEYYPVLGWTMRQCAECGYHQNHWRGDVASNRETMNPWDAAEQAPRIGPDGLVVQKAKVFSTAAPSTAELKRRADKIASVDVEVVGSEHPTQRANLYY